MHHAKMPAGHLVIIIFIFQIYTMIVIKWSAGILKNGNREKTNQNQNMSSLGSERIDRSCLDNMQG